MATGAKFLALEDASSQGYNLPRRLSPKYRNLLSADGCTYYLLPTPVKKKTKVGGGKTNSEVLDFARRYFANDVEAIFVGIKRGMSKKPIDCSYTDAKNLLLHNTPEQEILSTVERLACFKSGVALAMFDMPAAVRGAVIIKPKAAKVVVVSGKKNAKAVNVRVDFEPGDREGRMGCMEVQCRGVVYQSFRVEVNAKSIKQHLWNADFSVRLTEHGVLEFDAPDMDGTLYLGGKLENSIKL